MSRPESEETMKQYDVKCPVCGKTNHGLFLQETGGWMECENCGTDVEAVTFKDGKALPFLTSALCIEILARAAV